MKFIFSIFAFSVLGFSAIKAQTNWSIVKEELVFNDPPFKQCHASTLVEITSGKILLACFAGTHEGKNDVDIWITTIDKKGITNPRDVANGMVNDTLRYPTWNPVLFKLKDKIFLFYKVGPNPREWWGMVKTSTDNGNSWSKAEKLPENILGPIKNKPVLLKNGCILAPSSVEESTERWKAYIEKSDNSGKIWKRIPVDTSSEYDVIQPSILFYPHGKLQVLCRSKQGNVIQSWSNDYGNTWSKLEKTSLLNPNAGTDAITLKNGTQLIVYNPDVPGEQWFNGRSKLRVAKSMDGINWEDIIVLENGDKEEYSYPAIIQTNDGLIHISYTFNRKNIKHVVLKQK